MFHVKRLVVNPYFRFVPVFCGRINEDEVITAHERNKFSVGSEL